MKKKTLVKIIIGSAVVGSLLLGPKLLGDETYANQQVDKRKKSVIDRLDYNAPEQDQLQGIMTRMNKGDDLDFVIRRGVDDYVRLYRECTQGLEDPLKTIREELNKLPWDSEDCPYKILAWGKYRTGSRKILDLEHLAVIEMENNKIKNIRYFPFL